MVSRCSRREFMGLTAAGAAGLAASPYSSWRAVAAESSEPDLVVFNAKVFTVDPLLPRAQAFAVKGGRFVAVGATEDMKSLIGKSTRTHDAQQMTIVPGFIDAHNHAPGGVLLYEVLVGNPYDVEFVSIAGIIDKLRARAQDTPPGTWVEGYFFDDTKVADQRSLDIHDLDKVSRDHPVAVRHRGGHTTYYNSKAFELAGITENVKDSAAGTFDRDHDGKLNGRVTDRARLAFESVGNRRSLPPQQEDRSRAAQAYMSKQFVRYGLTGVHHQGGDLFALQEVRARGELLHRVSYEPQGDMLEAMIKNGIATGFGDEWIRLGATAEHTCDGSFSERTMALSVPYPGVEPPYYGNLIFSQDELNVWIERVHRAAIQLNCHANGDIAIEMVLIAFERASALSTARSASQDHALHPDQ